MIARHKTRILAVAVAATMLGANISPAYAAGSFSDVKKGAWYEATIHWAVEQGIVSGYHDGTFRPGAILSEAEFLVMLFRSDGTKGRAAVKGEAWFAPYYEKALERGFPVTIGNAKKPIARGQAAILIAASFGKELDLSEAVQYVLDEGMSKGKTAATLEGYEPQAFMTRAEAVMFVRNVTEYREALPNGETPVEEAEAQTPPILSGGGGGPGPTPTPPPDRPDGPVRTEGDLQERTEQLEDRVADLGVTVTTTAQGLSVSHPDRADTGATLTQTSDSFGYVQILDDRNDTVIDSAHALLRFTGVAIDQQTFEKTIETVQSTGNNAALKIGNQLVTFVRSATNPGQLTINYTLFE